MNAALHDGLKFIVLFALVAGIFYYLTEPASMGMRTLAAQSSAALLGAFGVPVYVSAPQGEPLIQTANLVAVIVELCSGRLELAVLLGVILASADRTLKARLVGVAGAFGFVLIVNPVRIALTMQYFSPLVHDVLFRFTVLLLIIGYYALWYVGPVAFHSQVKRGAKHTSRSN